jgi:TonB family protein
LQDDDDGRGGEGGGFPLYISLSIGAAFVATLGVIGFVTFSNVQSSATPYVVAVRAPDRAAAPTSPYVARAALPAPAAPTRRIRRVASLHESPEKPAPSPSAPALERPSPRPLPTASAQAAATKEPAALAKAASPGRRIAQNPTEARSDVPVAPASKPAEAPAAARPALAAPAASAAAVAPAVSPAATVPPAREAAPADAPPAAATPSVVAAVQAPVYAPERVVEARVRVAAQPDFPNDPSVQGLRATSAVLVTIGPTGRVIRAAIDKSSGHRAFDEAALEAARNSAYAPPLIDGRPATASYRMVYEFSQ